MVHFTPVDPASIPTERLGRRGRISYPLLKSFMEANVKVARLDDLPIDKNPSYLRSVLFSYIKNHNLPVKVFSADGDLHLMRLDLDDEGNPIPDYKTPTEDEMPTEGRAGHLRDTEALPITSEEVERRFAEDGSNTMK